jgi:hypothetical protein
MSSLALALVRFTVKGRDPTGGAAGARGAHTYGARGLDP